MSLASLAAIVLYPQADAHVGDLIDTLDAVDTPSGAVVEGTFGLVVQDGSGLHWVCHEGVTAVGAITSPDYVRSPTGTWISRMTNPLEMRDGHPLWASEDLCTWVPVPGFDGRIVADVAFGPDGSVWVATADPDGSNSLFHGADVNSLVAVLTEPGSRFLSVAVGAGVWATSSEGDTALTLWHSADGVAFTSHPIPVDPALLAPVDATVGIADPVDPDAAWVVLDPIGVDQILAVSSGGAVQMELWHAPDRVTDLSRAADGTIYAILGDRHPWQVTPTPTPLTDLPDSSGLDTSTRLVLAGRAFVNGVLLTVSDDFATPGSTYAPSDISGPLACPAGSDQALVCEPLWATLEPRLRARTDTGDTGVPAPPPPITEPEPEPQPCGCAGTPASGLWLAAAVLALLRRTRKPRNSPMPSARPPKDASPA